MESDQSNQFNLTVKTGDKASEKFILDSQFHRVASGVGEESVFRLPAGLYSIKIRAGFDYKETSISLFKDETVILDSIQFSSPAPLEGTGKTHEYQIEESKNHSHKIHCSIGKGSRIYLFARDWTLKDLPSNFLPSAIHPLQGLTLFDKQGNILVDFIKFADTNLNNSDQEPWAACNVELDPGIYRLNLETASGDILQQTIVASPDWQTQIFMLQRNYGLKSKDLRADLAGSSIFMSKIDEGFEPNKNLVYQDDTDFRLIDMVRQALIDKRNVLSDQIIDEIINGKFSNPMLGIYGAHLLLLNKKFEYARLQVIVNNLRNLLVLPHPDVEAIALKLNMPGNYIFDILPMLSNSWNFILEESVRRPGIVAPGSLACRYAGQFWNCDLWLIWGRTNEESNKNLYEQIKSFTQLASSSDKINIAPDQLISAQNEIANNSGGIAGSPEVQNVEFVKSSNFASTEIPHEQILPIVQALGLPAGKVAEILNDIKLSEVNSVVEKKADIKPPDIVDDDPQKGRWGGKSEINSRRMNAIVEKATIPNFYIVTISVESINMDIPLMGVVKFHLHNTFLNPDPVIAVQGGKAVLRLTKVWGSFTVGAEADDGKTMLELDLSQLPGVDEEFKER